MSKTVNVSELKTQLSHYLRLVRRGEVLFVRDRTQVVARLEAAGPRSGSTRESQIARLESEGVLRRRRHPMDVALLGRRVRAGRADVVGALLAEREEGR